MTRTLKLWCGASSIDLLSVTGIIPQREATGPKLTEDNLSGETPTVSETYRLNLLGTSSDNVATQIQALINILRNIARYRQKKILTPVYLEAQITGETNPRYALVHSCYQFDHPNSFRTPLELDHTIENFGFTLTREHPWGSVIPGTLTANPLTLAPNDGPASPTMVHIGNFCDDVALTHLYNVHTDFGTIPVYDAEGHASNGSGNNTVNVNVGAHSNKALFIFVFAVGAAVPSVAVTVAGAAATLVKDFGAGVIANSTLQLWKYIAPANGANAVVATLGTNTGNIMEVLSYYNVDQTEPLKDVQNANFTTSPFSDTVTVNPNGLTIDGVLCYYSASAPTITVDGSQTSRENYQLAAQFYKMGMSEKAGGTAMQWTANNVTGAIHFAASINPVMTYTFSANLFNGNTITLWPAGPVVGDWILAGASYPWHHLVLNIKTAAVINADLQIEVWTGATWVALIQGTQYSIYPSGAAGAASGIFNATGDWVININPPSTWAPNALNGVTDYWMRIRINAVTTWTTSPVTSDTQVPYFLKSNWLEIPAAASAGDASPIPLLRLATPNGAGMTPCFSAHSLLLLGARSVGLTKFVSDLNWGGSGNPADWALTNGTDASTVTDINAPRGKACSVSFATSTASVVRASLAGTGMLAYWYGEFRVLITAQQIGGSAGNTRIKLRTCIGTIADADPKFDTKAVNLATHDAGYEVVDLGILKLPFSEITNADSLAADIIFQLMAERLSGASSLRIGALVLLPIDLWYCRLEDPLTNIALGSSALRGASSLDLDGGMLGWRCTKFIKVGGNLIPSENWLAKGRALNVEPATKTRVYFLMMHYPASWGVGPLLATTGMAVSAQIYAKNRYNVLRGAA